MPISRSTLRKLALLGMPALFLGAPLAGCDTMEANRGAKSVLSVLQPPKPQDAVELALSVNDATVLPWRPESWDEEGDNIVSFARVDSPLYGTVFLVCGRKLQPGPLGVSSRAFDRLCAAARSALNF